MRCPVLRAANNPICRINSVSLLNCLEIKYRY